MCGVAGIVSAETRDPEVLDMAAASMAAALELRGPDDYGTWVDEHAGVALGHRRLSIIDLSEFGHQPMVSGTGRFVLTFNGEIYNFSDLRTELASHGHHFRGQSDTEVILAAFTQWGVLRALPRFNGMFALGVWDRDERALYLVRDRIGEKPLYYGWARGNLLFASDLRAIERHPAFEGVIDRDAVAQYLRFGYVPAPVSIYRGFFKLPPGCVLRFNASDAQRPDDFSPDPDSQAATRPSRYWSARDATVRALSSPFPGTQQEATLELEKLLKDSVLRRMVADVPLGMLLSGGVDSSTIAALMQAQSSTPIKTFTIGFREHGWDEAGHARAVASHLKTDHAELYLSPAEALGIIDRLPAIYDEPFADASQIPTTLLSGLVRRRVTVALSGDGGDEVFGGYNRYLLGPAIWNRVGWIPAPLRKAVERLIRVPSTSQWERLAGRFDGALRGYGANGTLGDKFHKLADVLAMPNADALYERLVTSWADTEGLVNGGSSRVGQLAALANGLPTGNAAARMMWLDLVTYLPDDILVKVDRASMGSSLEVRVPLLDHRIVEFAWSLPHAWKLPGDSSKRILRDVLYRYVPREMIERPKMGFGVPIHHWLRGALREWGEELLDEKHLREDGLLNPEPIRARWLEHQSGRRRWEGPLWSVLMLQSWLRSRHPAPRRDGTYTVRGLNDSAVATRPNAVSTPPPPRDVTPVPAAVPRKVLILCNYPFGVAPSQRFRFEQYLDILRQAGIDLVMEPFFTAETWPILYKPGFVGRKAWAVLHGFIRRLSHVRRASQFDYVFLHLEGMPVGPPIIEWLLFRRGTKVVFDIDDLIFKSRTSRANWIVAPFRWRSKIAYISRHAFRVTGCNNYLADWARQFNPKASTLPTTIDPQLYVPRSLRPQGRPVIGWTGSRSNLPYLNIVLPALQRLQETHDFAFHVICDLPPPPPPLRHYKFVKWSAATEIASLHEFDIGLMPVPDDLWSKGKVGLKAIQYSALEIVPVASDSGSGPEVVTQGVTGLLVKNTEAEWYEALKWMLDNRSEWPRMGVAAREHVMGIYSIPAQAGAYVGLFTG